MRIAAIVLLFLLGLGAIVGGSMLIIDPTGALLSLPFELLQHGPFDDYLLPGILLLVFNGICSMVVALLLILNRKWGQKLLILQGVILSIWITVQIIIIQDFYLPLHGFYYLLSMFLVFFGVRMTLNRRSS